MVYVKAVIMAGGEGKRLKAVTGDMPKPMVPLVGRPMLEHIILLLKKHGFTDICAALKYRAEDIVSYFGNGERYGVKLQYRVERDALGTAGGVKNCADFYGDDDFLVISGDAACDMDLGRLMKERRASGAAAAMALSRCGEPLSYGLAVTDAGGYVRSFIEKPRWNRVVTDLVNTGIYVLTPRAMEAVPEGKSFDFGRDLFPLLLSRGEKLLGLALDGYWCDVGSPLSYYRCCADALTGRLKLSLGDGFSTVSESGDADAPDTDGDGARLICRCRDRAALMGALSEAMLDMGADFSDGIRLSGRGYRLHIAPLATRPAVRVAVSSQDTEFARNLALSAKELIDALGL